MARQAVFIPLDVGWGVGFMRLVSRLRRALAMTAVLLGLLAGLGVASAQADAPAPAGSGPHVAEQTPAIPPNSATNTPLPSPPETASPLSSATPNPDIPSSPTGTSENTDSASDKPSDQTDNQVSHMVRFDPADGSKPTQASVKTGTLAAPPEHNPQREGFRFDGWMLDGQPYDFQAPVLQDTTLKAQWSKTTDWMLSPDHGPATGTRLTINPPDKQEPRFSSIHAAGEQAVGLTGDGRIYTWTKDSTPKQVPSPAHAAEGFHYLRAAAGSRWRAALGSDQQVYTWTSQQATPTILNTDRNTEFTSISTDNDRLLAVDRQGQVHAYQASQAGSQDQTPKFTEQATASLPGQAGRGLFGEFRGLVLAAGLAGLVGVDLSLPVHRQEPVIVRADAGELGVPVGVEDGGRGLLAGPGVDLLVGSQGGPPPAAGCGPQVVEPFGGMGGGGHLFGCAVFRPCVDAAVAGQADGLFACGVDAAETWFLLVGRVDGQAGAGGGPVVRAQHPVRGFRPLGFQGRVLEDGGLEVIGLAVKHPPVEPEALTLRIVFRRGGESPGLHARLGWLAAVGRVETHHMRDLIIRLIGWLV